MCRSARRQVLEAETAAVLLEVPARSDALERCKACVDVEARNLPRVQVVEHDLQAGADDGGGAAAVRWVGGKDKEDALGALLVTEAVELRGGVVRKVSSADIEDGNSRSHVSSSTICPCRTWASPYAVGPHGRRRSRRQRPRGSSSRGS